MIWALSALLATFFFSATNFIDKSILHRHLGSLSNVGYLSLAGVAAVPFLLIGILVKPEPILHSTLPNALLPFGAGLLFSAAFAIYIKCLSTSDTSMTASLFQLTIFWNILFGWIVFSEHLNLVSLIAMAALLLATFFLSHEIDDRGKRNVRHEIYLWMLFSCLLLSISDVLFKYAFEHGQSYFAAQFYDYLASTSVALILMIFVKKIRLELLKILSSGAKVLFLIVLINETINLIGFSLARLSIIHLPIASAQSIMGIQPLILIILGIVLTKLWPHRFNEHLGKRHIGEKIAAAAVIVLAEIVIVVSL